MGITVSKTSLIFPKREIHYFESRGIKSVLEENGELVGIIYFITQIRYQHIEDQFHYSI